MTTTEHDGRDTGLLPEYDLDGSLEARHRQHHLDMVKTEEDVLRYAYVIEHLAPSLIVEVGTFSGKSALWFAEHAPVLTIDVTALADAEVGSDVPERWTQAPHPIRQHVGLSSGDAAVAAVRTSAGKHPGPVLLSLDADHSASAVAAELELYASVADYIVVEDTLVRFMPAAEVACYSGSPYDAVEAFLASHGEWERDTDVEAMFDQSQFPCGWLRRTGTRFGEALPEGEVRTEVAELPGTTVEVEVLEAEEAPEPWGMAVSHPDEPPPVTTSIPSVPPVDQEEPYQP